MSADIVGIALAILGIAITLLLYFFDLRKKISSIADFLGVMRTEQTKELAKIDKDVQSSRFGVISKQSSGLNKLHGEIIDRLTKLDRQSEGTINRVQALKLMDLYLDSVKIHLELALNRYAMEALPAKFKSGQAQEIMNDLNAEYQSVVTNSMRHMVAPFMVRGGRTFQDVLNSVGRKGIDDAFERIEKRLSLVLEHKEEQGTFIASLRRELHAAGLVGSKAIADEIARIYQLH